MSKTMCHLVFLVAGGLVINGFANPSEARQRVSRSNRDYAWVSPEIKAPRLHQDIFYSKTVHAKVSYHIYIPKQYDADKTKRFGVLYWLHGTTGGAKGLPILPVYFDKAIEQGKIPPMLIVFPHGPFSMWCNSKDGLIPMETMFIKDLIPHIDATYRTRASRSGRILEGFSMGGYGTARLGFKYSELFGAISILSGGPLQVDFLSEGAFSSQRQRQFMMDKIYGGSQAYFKSQSPWVLATQNASKIRRQKTLVRHVIGTKDGMLSVVRRFEAHLTELKIPHTYTEVPGASHHPMQILKGLGEKSWAFYRQAFGQTP